MTATFQSISDSVKGYNGSALSECLLAVGKNIAPLDNALLPSSLTQITLEWEAVVGAEWYVVQVSLNSDFRGSTTRGYKLVNFNLGSSSETPSSDECYTNPPTMFNLDVPNDVKRGFKYYWRVFPYSKCNGACSGPPSVTHSFTIKAPNLDLDCEDDVTLTPISGIAKVGKGSFLVYSVDWSAPSQFFISTEWTVDGEGAVVLNSSDNTILLGFNKAETVTLTFCLKEGSGGTLCCKTLEIEVIEAEEDESQPQSGGGSAESASSGASSASSAPSSASSAPSSTSLPSSGSTAPSSNPCEGVTETYKIAIVISSIDGCYKIEPCDFYFEEGRLCSVDCDAPVSSG